MMPKVDGFDVLRRVRGAAPTRAIPIILLTAPMVLMLRPFQVRESAVITITGRSRSIS